MGLMAADVRGSDGYVIPWYATERYTLASLKTGSKGKVKVEGNTVWVDYDATVTFQHPGGERPPAYMTVITEVHIRIFKYSLSGWKFVRNEDRYEDERVMYMSSGDAPLILRGLGNRSWKPSKVERKDEFKRLLITGNTAEGLLWQEAPGEPRWTDPGTGTVDDPPVDGVVDTVPPGYDVDSTIPYVGAGGDGGSNSGALKVILLIALVLLALGGGWALRGVAIRKMLGLGGS